MKLDRTVPLPLHYQIAEALRYRIATGALAAGERLPSLREAADKWQVNLHTVRRAYKSLEQQGFLEIKGPRGTLVRHLQPEGSEEQSTSSLSTFVGVVAEEARRRFGAQPQDLAAAIQQLSPAGPESAPEAWAIECIGSLSETIAAHVSRRWCVRARPWPLERAESVPPGIVLSTYFHYNEIRRRLRGRIRDASFVVIRPDATVANAIRVSGRTSRVTFCETDEAVGHNIAADLEAALPGLSVDVRVPDVPATLLTGVGRGDAVIFSPHSWRSLSRAERASPAAFELRCVVDSAELDRVAQRRGWVRR